MPRRFEVVEDDCIGCGLCSERAPDNLEMATGGSLAQVFKQPATEAEERACLEASDYCPTGGLKAAREASPAAAPAPPEGDGPVPFPFILAGDSTPAGRTS